MKRNYSFNTIVPGVRLDLVDELPSPYFQTRESWEQVQKAATGQEWKPTAFEAGNNVAAVVQRLAAALQEIQIKNPAWWAENQRRKYLSLLRWQLADKSTNNLRALATSFYQLNLFADWEKGLKAQGRTTAREIERAIAGTA